MPDKLPLLIGPQTKGQIYGVRGVWLRVLLVSLFKFGQVVKQNLIWSTDDKLRPLDLVQLWVSLCFEKMQLFSLQQRCNSPYILQTDTHLQARTHLIVMPLVFACWFRPFDMFFLFVCLFDYPHISQSNSSLFLFLLGIVFEWIFKTLKVHKIGPAIRCHLNLMWNSVPSRRSEDLQIPPAK